MEIRPDCAILTDDEVIIARRLATFADKSVSLRPVSEFLPQLPAGINHAPVVITDSELGALEIVASRASKRSLRYRNCGSALLKSIVDAPYIDTPGLMTSNPDNELAQPEHNVDSYESLCEFGIAAADSRNNAIASRQIPIY
jgi:hypothetical protein